MLVYGHCTLKVQFTYIVLTFLRYGKELYIHTYKVYIPDSQKDLSK